MKSLIVFGVAALFLTASTGSFAAGSGNQDERVSAVSEKTPAPLPLAQQGPYGDDGTGLEPKNEGERGGKSSTTGGRSSETSGKSMETGGESRKTGGESRRIGGESSTTGGKGSGGQDNK